MRRAGVTVRPLHTSDECVEGAALLANIWGTSLESSPLSGDLLTSLIHAGGCVLGATDADDRLVGLTVGVAGAPQSDRVYSLIAGVDPGHAGRGIGMALKQTQRVWAIERGATQMVWTYDPLVRRNAHFNLNRLGAHTTGYLPDFYPPMHDALNRSDLTDRLTVVWDLLRPKPGEAGAAPQGYRLLEADEAGEPQPCSGKGSEGGAGVEGGEGGQPLLVWIPPDIEATRRSDPALAMRWRLAVREALRSTSEAGYHPYRITADGFYLLSRGDDRP
jgi:predicted GNAT superfamily acetyltransferase